MDELFYYPARVARAQISHLFPGDQELLARYRERFPDSPVDNPFFLRTEISNNSLDWYYTHMLTDSLRNYADDAESGVGLQDSHSPFRLGYGRSLFGAYHSEPGHPPGWDRRARRGAGEAQLAVSPPDQYERTVSVAHIIPGLRFNSNTYASTDDFIAAIQGGTVEEISIGFAPGRMTCDICGGNYFSWSSCPHLAGFSYEIERNEQQQNLLCTVGIGDSHLTEYSAVYAGATPNAVVVRKAQDGVEDGLVTSKQAAVIEQRYRVALPLARAWPGFSNPMVLSTIEETTEESEENTMEFEEQVNAILSETNAPGDEPLERLRWLVAENARLQPLAEQGEQYRADLIEQALAEGVRAMGETFPRETYDRMFEGATIEHIKRVRDAWAAQARKLFSAGRKTVDEERQPPQREPVGSVPKHAYKS